MLLGARGGGMSGILTYHLLVPPNGKERSTPDWAVRGPEERVSFCAGFLHCCMGS